MRRSAQFSRSQWSLPRDPRGVPEQRRCPRRTLPCAVDESEATASEPVAAWRAEVARDFEGLPESLLRCMEVSGPRVEVAEPQQHQLPHREVPRALAQLKSFPRCREHCRRHRAPEESVHVGLSGPRSPDSPDRVWGGVRDREVQRACLVGELARAGVTERLPCGRLRLGWRLVAPSRWRRRRPWASRSVRRGRDRRAFRLRSRTSAGTSRHP
jgi:hypothetical protein